MLAGDARQMVERMTLLARLYRRLSGASEFALESKAVAALLQNINRQPSIRELQRRGGQGEGEAWTVEGQDIQLIQIARSWPCFQGKYGAPDEASSRQGDSATVDSEAWRRAWRIVARVGDEAWEDSCVGEIAAMLLCESHPRSGARVGDGSPPEASLSSAFPLFWSLASELSNHAASECLESVMALSDMVSLRRFDEVAETLRAAAIQHFHVAASSLYLGPCPQSWDDGPVMTSNSRASDARTPEAETGQDWEGRRFGAALVQASEAELRRRMAGGKLERERENCRERCAEVALAIASRQASVLVSLLPLTRDNCIPHVMTEKWRRAAREGAQVLTFFPLSTSLPPSRTANTEPLNPKSLNAEPPTLNLSSSACCAKP
jgi:hypothetical protein